MRARVLASVRAQARSRWCGGTCPSALHPRNARFQNARFQTARFQSARLRTARLRSLGGAEVVSGDTSDFNINGAHCDTLWKCLVVSIDQASQRARTHTHTHAHTHAHAHVHNRAAHKHTCATRSVISTSCKVRQCRASTSSCSEQPCQEPPCSYQHYRVIIP